MSRQVLAVAQAFKGSMAAAEVSEAWTRAIEDAAARAIVLVASDGGDGLLEALAGRLTQVTQHTVTGPLKKSVHAKVGWFSPISAVIESRLACGLSLLRDRERDPLTTTSRGVGELILQAVELGAREIFVGLGGSATADCGLGMARSWGWGFADSEGNSVAASYQLERLSTVSPGIPPGVSLTGLCDVSNPLTGPNGAVIYVPQKGGSEDECAILERGWVQLARIMAQMCGRDYSQIPGTGAAGGIGFGLMAFAGGELVSGSDWVLQTLGFEDALATADLVVVGEGKFDETSLWGKLSGNVLRRASQTGVPAVLVSPQVAAADTFGAHIVTGGAIWDREELYRRSREGIAHALSLLAP
ncbi:MAG: glycerate kinase [Gemmatimonadetes bacterium]|nr:glycerate kinase [Gemmatimonadota bacterium]